MNRREIDSIIKKLRTAEKRVAAERDKLRDLLDEIEGFEDTTDRGATALREAIDALSELV